MRFGPVKEPGRRVPLQRLTGFSEADELAVISWSEPVLFFPDGSATDTEIELNNVDGRTVQLCVRGLTGAASVRRPEK